MARTSFVDGTVVTPDFLNDVFTHVHDGQNADGHAAQVDLGTCVVNTLPLAQVVAGLSAKSGLALSAAATGDAWDITIQPGYAALLASSGNPAYVSAGAIATSAWVKRLIATGGTNPASWVAGSGNGGCGGGFGLSDQQWIYVYAIRQSSTGLTDFGFDVSATAANLRTQSGYDQYRRIGFVYLLASGGKIVVKPFLQYGSRFLWAVPVADKTSFGVGNSATLIPVTVPPSSGIKAILALTAAAGGPPSTTWGFYYWDGVLGSGGAPSAPQLIQYLPAAGMNYIAATPQLCVVAQSGQAYFYAKGDPTCTVGINVLTAGWIDD